MTTAITAAFSRIHLFINYLRSIYYCSTDVTQVLFLRGAGRWETCAPSLSCRRTALPSKSWQAPRAQSPHPSSTSRRCSWSLYYEVLVIINHTCAGQLHCFPQLRPLLVLRDRSNTIILINITNHTFGGWLNCVTRLRALLVLHDRGKETHHKICSHSSPRSHAARCPWSWVPLLLCWYVQ